RDRRRLRLDLDAGPVRDAHDRLDDLHARREELEILRLVRRAEQVRVGRVRLLRRLAVRQAVLLEPRAHLRPAAKLADEVPVEPRLVDAQILVLEQPVAVEALDVVPLVRRAVAPDLDAVCVHLAHEQGSRDRPPERRRVEVAATRGLDVERAAAQRREALARERVLAVDEDRVLRSVREGALGNGADVRLVVLPEIGREGVRDCTVLAHPGDRAARVEAAGEGDPDALPDRKRREDDRSRALDDAHAACRCCRSSSASCAPVTGSRETSSTVFSPATVPAMCGWRAMSIDCASGLAYPYGVVTTTRLPLASTVSAQRRSAPATSSLKPESSANADTSRPLGWRTLMRPSSCTSRDTVVCTTS